MNEGSLYRRRHNLPNRDDDPSSDNGFWDSVRTVDLTDPDPNVPSSLNLDHSSSKIRQRSFSARDENSMWRRWSIMDALQQPTVSLPLINFLDMLAVSLVVPLLFQYYQRAGVQSANQREWLSSVFSTSQIIGGVGLGALADAQTIDRTTILYVSLGGSALSYALLVYGDWYALIASRIVVGLVKQTKTVTTSLLTRATNEENRATYMGRLESSTTAAWIVGPSLGAVLYRLLSPEAPAMLACFLFVLNLTLAVALMHNSPTYKYTTGDNETSSTFPSKQKSDFWSNIRKCFQSKELGTVISAMLLVSWVTRATSYSTMGSYYEDMYQVEPYYRGFIQSYQRVLGFVVQSSLIGPLLRRLGGERQAACISAVLLAVATFGELPRSWNLFIAILLPAIALATTLGMVSLRSLLTRVAPEESLFSVFAAWDVLQNVSAVTVPFYRTALFQLLGGGSKTNDTAMAGDPDPVSWAFTAGVHWLVTALLLLFLLRPTSSSTRIQERRAVGGRSKELKRI